MKLQKPVDCCLYYRFCFIANTDTVSSCPTRKTWRIREKGAYNL